MNDGIILGCYVVLYQGDTTCQPPLMNSCVVYFFSLMYEALLSRVSGLPMLKRRCAAGAGVRGSDP